MTLQELAEKSIKLPLKPGVYIMKDKTGKVIYVGKAKKLKNRVHGYFVGIGRHQPKVFQMVTHVNDFDFIVTASEFEALILECSLIKQYSPKYNILLKDDKGYHYVKITPGDYPNIEEAKQKAEGDGCTYIGPYISGFVVSKAVSTAKKAFGLPDCKRKFPEDIGKERPCLNYHIKQCCGLCTGKVSRGEYNKLVQGAIEYITKGEKAVIEDMRKEMMQLAEDCQFEKAAVLRDRINSMEKIKERQQVVFETKTDMDAIAIARDETQICAVVLKFRNGHLSDKEEFLMKDDLAAEDILNDFVLQYYASRSDIPKEVLCEMPLPDGELIAQMLTEKRGNKVSVLVPSRGEKASLVKMAYDNAVTGISYRKRGSARKVASLDELSKLLGLTTTPNYIESYDISNLGEEYKVCGMVVFENAQPKKSAYKRFKIKTVDGQDDYASMKEAVYRRLKRYKDGDDDPGFAKKPDLILLDGGKGHVSVIRALVAEMGLDIPVFGMAKDSKHRTRALAYPDGEIALAPHKAAFKLCTNLQDEVHRYAISYQRKLHKNSALKSSLTDIPGVGEKTAKKLLASFNSLQEIEMADIYTLMDKAGVSKKTAMAIFDFYHANL